jgi:hypothetical protein
MVKLKSNKRSKLSVLPVVPVEDYQAGSQWWVASHQPTLSTVPSVSGELITVMGPYSPGAVVQAPSSARNRAVSRAERNASFIGPIPPLAESVRVGKRVVGRDGKALPSSVFSTGGNGAAGMYDLAGNKAAQVEHVPTSRKLVTASADYVSGLEIVGRSGVCSYAGQDFRFESDCQSACDEPAFESAKAASAWASLGDALQSEFRQAFATKQLDFRSRWSASGCASRLSMLADYVGRRMGRRFGNVSETSKIEAGLAGRAAVVAACSFSFGGDVQSGFVESYFMASHFREVSRIALRAGSASLLDELTGGQTGRDCDRRELRGGGDVIGEVESVGSYIYPLDGGESLPLAVRESFAAECGAMVRRALAARLSSGIHGAIAIGRYTRAAVKVEAVLAAVASGDSLELACSLAGYAWERSHNRSKGFSAAMESLGLGGYCVGRAARSVAPALADAPASGYEVSPESVTPWLGIPDYIPAP